jgi:hypothetical protein
MAWKGIEPVDETSSIDGWTIDAAVLLVFLFSVVLKVEPTKIRFMAAGPKRLIGLLAVKIQH